MKRTKAFTLVELLVVVAIIALLAAILLPALGRAQELANQVVCGSNLKNIGTGIRMYQSDNKNSPPWLNSFNGTDGHFRYHNTGLNAKSISTPGLVSPTALMFLLVRTGQSVDLFRCPSDDNATEMAKIRFTHTDGESYYYWDFYDTVVDDEADGAANSRKVSYSYQNPILDDYDPPTFFWKSGYTKSSRAGLAVMADKTPDYDIPSFYEFDWAVDPMNDEYRRSGMSQNHDFGDFINVLFADSHVKGSRRADVGIDNDNIYTTFYTGLGTYPGNTKSCGKAHPYNHRSEDDSYLVGPVK